MAYKQELWLEAKKRCRLGEEEIRMAKEMGLNPMRFPRALEYRHFVQYHEKYLYKLHENNIPS